MKGTPLHHGTPMVRPLVQGETNLAFFWRFWLMMIDVDRYWYIVGI